MGEIVSIVSGKGGVGKTTLCTCLAFSLVFSGKKVLCIDGDKGLKNLDLLLGMESMTVFDLSDVLEERVTLKKALVAHTSCPNLQLLSAAHDYNEVIDPEKLRALCERVRPQYDFILIDAPAGIGEGFSCAVYASDRSIVVATPDITSVHDAERTAGLIFEKRNMPVHLVINRIRPVLMEKGEMNNIDEIMDRIGVPLLGMIPEDEQVIIGANRFDRLLKSKTVSAEPFRNVAARLCGAQKPLARLWKRYAKR